MKTLTKPLFLALIITTQILYAANVNQAQPYQTISTQESIVGDDLLRIGFSMRTSLGSFNGPVIMFAGGHGRSPLDKNLAADLRE